MEQGAKSRANNATVGQDGRNFHFLTKGHGEMMQRRQEEHHQKDHQRHTAIPGNPAGRDRIVTTEAHHQEGSQRRADAQKEMGPRVADAAEGPCIITKKAKQHKEPEKKQRYAGDLVVAPLATFLCPPRPFRFSFHRRNKSLLL